MSAFRPAHKPSVSQEETMRESLFERLKLMLCRQPGAAGNVKFTKLSNLEVNQDEGATGHGIRAQFIRGERTALIMLSQWNLNKQTISVSFEYGEVFINRVYGMSVLDVVAKDVHNYLHTGARP